MARRRHGHATRLLGLTPEYHSWSAMISRCTARPSNSRAHNYVDRGITVCERWRRFEAFLEDMGSRLPGTTLDRIDNNRGYEPGNCRWATREEQQSNMRRSRRVTARGKTQTVAQWARELGTSSATITYRLAAGWPAEDAVSLPLDQGRPRSERAAS